MQICKYANMQICKCACTWFMYTVEYTAVQIHTLVVSVNVHAQMYDKTGVHTCKYRNAGLHNSINSCKCARSQCKYAHMQTRDNARAQECQYHQLRNCADNHFLQIENKAQANSRTASCTYTACLTDLRLSSQMTSQISAGSFLAPAQIIKMFWNHNCQSHAKHLKHQTTYITCKSFANHMQTRKLLAQHLMSKDPWHSAWPRPLGLLSLGLLTPPHSSMHQTSVYTPDALKLAH